MPSTRDRSARCRARRESRPPRWVPARHCAACATAVTGAAIVRRGRVYCSAACALLAGR